ncbi:MAG: SDR family oxidoreductase [Legionellales bacterium]|nr:SDR family oxidoreductase [Legionellales bacterium]
MNHQQRNYIIFGASGGIGSATATELVHAGGRVLLAGRNETSLQALAEQLQQPYYLVDATDVQAVQDCVQQAQQDFGDIHGVVNCVGSILLKPVHLLTEAQWQTTLQLNLTSAFAVVRAACTAMLKTGGHIVLLSTAACCHLGLPNHEAIAAAKAGVIGLMQSTAATYAKHHIRVNCIAPGLIESPLSAFITQNPKALAISLKHHPLGRIGTPHDISRGIVFLLDRDADWITGQVLAIDGGLSVIK